MAESLCETSFLGTSKTRNKCHQGGGCEELNDDTIDLVFKLCKHPAHSKQEALRNFGSSFLTAWVSILSRSLCTRRAFQVHCLLAFGLASGPGLGATPTPSYVKRPKQWVGRSWNERSSLQDRQKLFLRVLKCCLDIVTPSETCSFMKANQKNARLVQQTYRLPWPIEFFSPSLIARSAVGAVLPSLRPLFLSGQCTGRNQTSKRVGFSKAL